MKTIPFSPPDIGEDEISAVSEVLRSGWITTGPTTKRFETELAKFCGTNRMACLNSATAAEELNLRVLGISEGDEVIVPAYTYTSTASAAIHAGAKVIFADIQPDGDELTRSPEMDYNAAAELITEKTKALIPVDMAGIMCNYERIYQVVEAKKNIFRPANKIQEAIGHAVVVSDCAHALGAQRAGKRAGSVSDFSSFSFHAVKNLTTAEGGASSWTSIDGIDDDEIYGMYQLLSLHGQSKTALAKNQPGSWEYDIKGTYYKCNMTDIMAAIGLSQLARYEAVLRRRREIITLYDSSCDELGIIHLNHYGTDHASSGHLYLTRIPGISEAQRNEIIRKMGERGIACNVHYKPLPMMTAYKNLGWNIKDFPNAYNYYRNLISLPLYNRLSDEDAMYIMENYRDVLRDYL